MKSQPRELLLLWDHARSAASTVAQHIRSLEKYSRHAIRPVAIMRDLPPHLDLSRFDAVVLHYSLVLCSSESVSDLARLDCGSRGLRADFPPGPICPGERPVLKMTHPCFCHTGS